MKNINLGLNILLLLAVGFLLVQYFKAPAAETQKDTMEAKEAAGLNIVYVNTDSLVNNYEVFRKSSESLAQREQEAGKNLQSKQQALEKDFRQVQQKVQQGLLAPNQIADEEQRLSAKQQSLAKEQESLSRELMQESQQLNEKFQKNIKEVLSDLQEEKAYDYILSYGPGTGVLMVNDSLDITSMVVERLNAMEAKEEEPETGGSDQ